MTRPQREDAEVGASASEPREQDAPAARPEMTPAPTLRREIALLLALAWPIALAQLGMMSLHLVDTAIVGHSSVDDLAGVALGRNIAFLCVSAAMGLPISLEALATQAIGAGEAETAWSALRGALRASLVAWLPVTVMSLAATLALVPLGVEPPVARRALLFVLANAPGAYGFLVFLSAKTFLQAHGQTRPALQAAIIANVFNFVACSLLVRGDDALTVLHLPLSPMGLPKLGSLGAGISASLASLLMAALVLRSAWRHRASGDAARREASVTRLPAMPIKRIARLGLPIGLQLLAEVGVFSVVGVVAGSLGPQVVAAHQIALSMASTTFMAVLGVSGATAVRVGVAVGAGHPPRRIGFVAVGLGLGIMSIGATLFLVFPDRLARVFTSDPEVVAMAVRLLRVAAMFQLFDATQGVVAGALRGAGDVRFPFMVMLTGYWAVAFPLALTLGFGLGWGAVGLWWGLSVGLGIVALALLARFSYLTSRTITRV